MKKTLPIYCLLVFLAIQTLKAQKIEKPESALYGTWETTLFEKGKKFTIRYTFISDNTSLVTMSYDDSVDKNAVKWYFDGTYLFETVKVDGKDIERYGEIEWVADDCFILKIIDNGTKTDTGVRRQFKRVPRV